MRTAKLAAAAAAGTALCLGVSHPSFAVVPAWQVVLSAGSGNQDELSAVAIVSTRDAWAVGDSHTIVNGVAQQLPLIEHNTGSAWQVVPNPSPSGVPFVFLTSVAAVSASNVWAVGEDFTADHLRSGHPVVEHYDGTAWKLVTVPQADPVAGFTSVTATSTTDVWAVGGTGRHPRTGPTTRSPLVEHFDGTAWSVAPTPALANASLSGVAAASSTNVWAVGTQTSSGGAGFALHDDGTGWTQTPLPAPAVANTGWSLTGVAATPSGQAWSTGTYTASDGSQHALIGHFDGASWSIAALPDPTPGMTYTNLTAVAASSNTNVWIIGDTSAGNQQHTPFSEHFDGTTWHVVPVQHLNTNDTLSSVATNGTVVWAVGSTGATNSPDWQTLTEQYS